MSLTAPSALLSGAGRHDRAVTDAGRLLASPSPPAAVLSGIRHVLADQLSLDLDRGPAGTALLLAWLLRHRPGPFTPAAARLAGADVIVIPGGDRGRERRLTGAEATGLGICDMEGLRCWERDGLMVTATLTVAAVRLVVVPARIGGWDGEPFARIRGGEPCGQVLPGLSRCGRRAFCAWPEDPAVTASAALRNSTGIGWCSEQVTGDFIRHLACL